MLINQKYFLWTYFLNVQRKTLQPVLQRNKIHQLDVMARHFKVDRFYTKAYQTYI